MGLGHGRGEGAKSVWTRSSSLAAGLATLLLLFTQGCSSLAIPMPGAETGDTLGTGKGRASVDLGTARMFPLVDAASPVAGVAQGASVFEGAGFGISGAVGVGPSIDVQARAFFQAGGGGWRLGAKYKLWSVGPWAVGLQAGYGRYSGQGTIEYATPTGAVNVDQTLATSIGDLMVPASFRLGKDTALCAGLLYQRANVKGLANSSPVADTQNDTGISAGVRQGFGQFEGALSVMMLRTNDPFTDSTRTTAFFSLSGGITF